MPLISIKVPLPLTFELFESVQLVDVKWSGIKKPEKFSEYESLASQTIEDKIWVTHSDMLAVSQTTGQYSGMFVVANLAAYIPHYSRTEWTRRRNGLFQSWCHLSVYQDFHMIFLNMKWLCYFSCYYTCMKEKGDRITTLNGTTSRIICSR